MRWLRALAVVYVLGELLLTPGIEQTYAQAAAPGNTPGNEPNDGDAFPWEGTQRPQQTITVDPLEPRHRMQVNPDGSINVQAYPQPCYGVSFLSAANTNPKSILPGPGQLCSVLHITNSGATTANYLRFYDTAGQPTCSSATGVVWGVEIPVNSTAANIAGIVIPIPEGIQFNNGIGLCLTGAISNTDTTNAATGASVNFGVRLPFGVR